uniref:Uncharacterized protein n=1 Tax=Rhizophora mucronata TaxID=61149 RepID=A0A2P2L763_RHIMU
MDLTMWRHIRMEIGTTSNTSNARHENAKDMVISFPFFIPLFPKDELFEYPHTKTNVQEITPKKNIC